MSNNAQGSKRSMGDKSEYQYPCRLLFAVLAAQSRVHPTRSNSAASESCLTADSSKVNAPRRMKKIVGLRFRLPKSTRLSSSTLTSTTVASCPNSRKKVFAGLSTQPAPRSTFANPCWPPPARLPRRRSRTHLHRRQRYLPAVPLDAAAHSAIVTGDISYTAYEADQMFGSPFVKVAPPALFRRHWPQEPPHHSRSRTALRRRLPHPRKHVRRPSPSTDRVGQGQACRSHQSHRPARRQNHRPHLPRGTHAADRDDDQRTRP